YPSTTPCSDRVTISNTFFNTPIVDNMGKNYYFTLLGFSTDGGTTTSNSFISQEGGSNSAGLYAVITTVPVSTPDGGTTLALLGGALMGIGALRRKLSV
ncbi:MAG TPA: VPDSG-CTERM sorting domain-containing protein, partial [Luteitalea sp.]|nr:VPDSG-CTERM sorting domain-containing protein [Luteitalea sp.]